MKLIISITATAALAVLFTACPSTPPVATGINQGNAGTLKSLTPTLMAQSLRSFKGGKATQFAVRDAVQLGEKLGKVRLNGFDGVRTLGGASNSSGCDLPEAVDEDGDGYPKSLSATLNCTVNGVKISGQIDIKDADDTNPESGFAAAYKSFTITGPSGSSTATVKFDLSNSVTVKGSGYTDAQSLSVSVETSSEKAGLAWNSSLDYAPNSDGDNDDWDGGKVNFSDSLTVNAGADSGKFSVKGTALNLNAACEEIGVDAGTLEFTAGTDKLKLEFTACDAGTWTLNGKAE